MRTYQIDKGEHSASGLHFGVHFGITEQWYKVKFSKECLYKPLDWENDYNKVCGWSYGMHHKNSIRLCARPYYPAAYLNDMFFVPTMLEVCIYVYENGVRAISQKTLLLEVEKDYIFQLKYDTSIDTILANFPSLGNSMSMNYYAKPTCGYRLYPYFGGDKPASQTHTIKLGKL